MFSDQSGIELEINNKIFQKKLLMWGNSSHRRKHKEISENSHRK